MERIELFWLDDIYLDKLIISENGCKLDKITRNQQACSALLTYPHLSEDYLYNPSLKRCAYIDFLIVSVWYLPNHQLKIIAQIDCYQKTR